MPDAFIPPTVMTLIAEHLDSIPEVEAVLLFRENSDHSWTAEEAGRRLYVSTTVAEYIIARLHARGFLIHAGAGYRYDPQSTDLADAVDDLALAYRRHLVAVTQVVHSKPSQNVRDFADAFRLRKPRR